MIYNIFGVQIHSIDIKSFDKVENELIQYCYQEKKKDPVGVQLSNKGGWQSKSHGFRESFLFSLLQKSVFDYFEENKIFRDGVGIQMTNMWININGKGSYNMMHDHPQSDLAVIWYITDNMPGKLIFKDPHSFARSRLYNKINQSIPMKENINQQYAPVCNAGDILIFPADLLHGVTPSYKKELRISVSFNLLLKPY